MLKHLYPDTDTTIKFVTGKKPSIMIEMIDNQTLCRDVVFNTQEAYILNIC